MHWLLVTTGVRTDNQSDMGMIASPAATTTISVISHLKMNERGGMQIGTAAAFTTLIQLDNENGMPVSMWRVLLRMLYALHHYELRISIQVQATNRWWCNTQWHCVLWLRCYLQSSNGSVWCLPVALGRREDVAQVKQYWRWWIVLQASINHWRWRHCYDQC